MKNIKIYSTFLIALMYSMSLLAQEKQLVTAKVVTENNLPVAGAMIKSLTDPSQTVMTGADGMFTFRVSKNEALELTLNHTDKMVIVPDREETTIVINEQTKAIDYGFGIRHSQRESTGSVHTVYAQTIEQSGAINPENTLYGRLLGCTVLQNGGSPWAGGNPSVLVRGRGTNAANYSWNYFPTVLIDGVVRPWVALDIEDIESISVLKDAAIGALYGQSGANGVLNITTKRGKFNTPNEVRASYQWGPMFPLRLPKMVDGVGYANAINEAYRNDGRTDFMYSDYDIQDIESGKYPYLLPNVDWFKESIRSNGYRQIASLTFRGGSSNVAYYSKLNFSNEQGLLKPVNEFDNYDTQLKRSMFGVFTGFDVKISKTTDLNLGMYGNIAQFQRPGLNFSDIFGYMYRLPATAFPVKAEDGTWGGSSNSNYIDEKLPINPVAHIANRGYTDNHTRHVGVDGTIKQDLSVLLRGLSVDVRVGLDNNAIYLDPKMISNFRYTVSSYVRDPLTNEIPDENITHEILGAEALIDFTGYTFQGQYRHGFIYGKMNYETAWNRNVLYGSVGFSQEKTITDGQYNTLLQQHFLGQIHYAFNQKYIVDLAASYSGTNYLQKYNRFRFYPAVSAAWIVSDEDFLKNNAAIDFLKLRGSFGYSGNGDIPQNLYQTRYAQGGGYLFRDQNANQAGRIEQRAGTPDLSPELSRTVNFGVEYSIWKKLSGSVDLFHSYRTKIVANSDNNASGTLGVAAPYTCTGIVSNRGFEVGVNWMDKTGDFTYMIGGQYSYARNRIENMEESYKPYDYMRRTGKRIGQPFGYETLGFFKDQAEIDASLPQWGYELRPGDIKYKSQNNEPEINENDIVAIGSPLGYPGMYFSLAFTLDWKGLGINALFQGAADYSVILNTKGTYWGLGAENYTISQFMYDNSWDSERNPNARFPRLTSKTNDNNYQNNDIWIVNNPFVKLRNLEVYYFLPKKVLSKVSLNSAKLSLKCDNVFSIDKINIGDPEYIDAGYPLLSSYLLGLTITF